jgi:hypothetical protein
VRMTGRFSPRRRSRVKSIHHGVANLQRCVSLIMTCFRPNEGIGRDGVGLIREPSLANPVKI